MTKVTDVAMGAVSRYWTLVRIDATGKRKIEEIAPAKAFFEEVFSEFAAASEVPDAIIQRQLLQWVRDARTTAQEQGSTVVGAGYEDNISLKQTTFKQNPHGEGVVGAGLADTLAGKQITFQQNPPSSDEKLGQGVSGFIGDTNRRLLAERCLLCFISWQIEQVCLRLEAQFGDRRFSRRELLPFVLDDDGSLQPTSYQCFARKILHSLDQGQGSLTTWTIRMVKQHPELNAFLLEQGVYLISDWAILNDTRPKQLESILREFYHLTPIEIKQASRLLECYHAVYRAERLQQRQGRNRSKCTPPTPQQLQQIALELEPQTSVETLHATSLHPETVMAQLQKMASRLRQYRISARGGTLPPAPTEVDPDRIPSPDDPNNLENQDEQTEFLRFYRQQFLACLDLAVAQVTDSRVGKLQRKDAQKAEKFLLALSLFHCQGRLMTEIAKLVGLQAQYQVTRLLNLKEFRADVRQQLLEMLRDRVLDKAKYYTDMKRIQSMDKQIEEALNEQITKVLEEAQTDDRISKNRLKNLFSRTLCRHLDTRRN